MSRTADRATFTDPVRITLLEKDNDEQDTAVGKLTQSVNRLTIVLVGAIISFSTSAVLLAWQLSLSHPK